MRRNAASRFPSSVSQNFQFCHVKPCGSIEAKFHIRFRLIRGRKMCTSLFTLPWWLRCKYVVKIQIFAAPKTNENALTVNFSENKISGVINSL